MSVARETVAAARGGSSTTQLDGVARETPDVGSGIRAMQALALLPIRLYRRFLSPAIGPRCRYYPTCSEYAEQSIRELGALRGVILGAWRVLRCNPFSKGGLDPVSERTLFRAHAGRRDGDPA